MTQESPDPSRDSKNNIYPGPRINPNNNTRTQAGLTTRTLHRVCPFCGKPGMVLHMGGYLGTLYKCPSCQYVGPIALEGEETGEEDPAFNKDQNQLVEFAEPLSSRVPSETDLSGLSRANNIFNKAGLLFGLTFMALGTLLVLTVVRWPGGNDIQGYAFGLFGIGTFLAVISGLFLLLDKSRTAQSSD